MLFPVCSAVRAGSEARALGPARLLISQEGLWVGPIITPSNGAGTPGHHDGRITMIHTQALTWEGREVLGPADGSDASVQPSVRWIRLKRAREATPIRKYGRGLDEAQRNPEQTMRD